MSNQNIIENLQKHITLSKAEQELLFKHLVHKKVKKKQFLLHENQIAKDAAFVISGCMRSYSIDDNGFEHIIQFAPANWWITDMYSFISQSEGHLNIDALMDSEVLLLSRANQLKLFDQLPKLERYFRILTEKSLVSSRQRLLEGLSLSAKKRYKNFCNIYPTLINELPQKQIAAFIGVTPEFLSKLRGEMVGKSK
jgi:CRP/FNR family transcriptional regulator, anaerobic regulatory protein